jgi:hypothetical protein
MAISGNNNEKLIDLNQPSKPAVIETDDLPIPETHVHPIMTLPNVPPLSESPQKHTHETQCCDPIFPETSNSLWEPGDHPDPEYYRRYDWIRSPRARILAPIILGILQLIMWKWLYPYIIWAQEQNVGLERYLILIMLIPIWLYLIFFVFGNIRD